MLFHKMYVGTVLLAGKKLYWGLIKTHLRAEIIHTTGTLIKDLYHGFHFQGESALKLDIHVCTYAHVLTSCNSLKLNMNFIFNYQTLIVISN